MKCFVVTTRYRDSLLLTIVVNEGNVKYRRYKVVNMFRMWWLMLVVGSTNVELMKVGLMKELELKVLI